MTTLNNAQTPCILCHKRPCWRTDPAETDDERFQQGHERQRPIGEGHAPGVRGRNRQAARHDKSEGPAHRQRQAAPRTGCGVAVGCTAHDRRCSAKGGPPLGLRRDESRSVRSGDPADPGTERPGLAHSERRPRDRRYRGGRLEADSVALACRGLAIPLPVSGQTKYIFPFWRATTATPDTFRIEMEL